MIKRLLARAALLAVALSLAACDKPIENRDCNDPTVHELARKLLVLQFNEYSKPKTQQERLLEGMAQRPETATLLNTIKATHLQPDSVQLSEVQTLFKPDTPTSERPAALQDQPFLYGCSAKARVSLPAAAAERLAKVPVLAALTQVDGHTLTLDIFYTTERGSHDGRMEVGVAMAHPMLPMLLSVALRNDAAARPAGTAETKDANDANDTTEKAEQAASAP